MRQETVAELPQIRMLGNVDWQQWLIVPRKIVDQDVQWDVAGGRTVPPSTLPDFLKNGESHPRRDILTVVPTSDRPSIRLVHVAANPLPIDLHLAVHRPVRGTTTTTLQSDFLFLPRGQRHVDVELAEKLELFAIECNGRSVLDCSIQSSPLLAPASPPIIQSIEFYCRPLHFPSV